MTRPAQPDDGICDPCDALCDDLENLALLLGESYRVSYKASSLKVRRRYRKLLVALEAARQQRAHGPAFSAGKRSGAAARSPLQR